MRDDDETVKLLKDTLSTNRPNCVAAVFSNLTPHCHVRHDKATSATVEALVSFDLNWEMGMCPEQYLTPQWISLP